MGVALAAPTTIAGDSRSIFRRERVSKTHTPESFTPRYTNALQASELAVVRERTRYVEPALKTASRIHESVQDLRVRNQAYARISGFGFWSHAISLVGRSLGNGVQPPRVQKRNIEQTLSHDLAELKKVVERVIVPSLSAVREMFRGRTFEKTADTPKALLLISVPTEKVGKILSFDALKSVAHARVQASSLAKAVESGEGRIVVTRIIDGRAENLEFAYRRPGKVDIYIDGKRRGSMWTDDAYKVVNAFARGRELSFRKQQRFTDYTVY